MLMNNALIKVCVLDGEYSSHNQKNSPIVRQNANPNSLFDKRSLVGFSFNEYEESTCSRSTSTSYFYSSYYCYRDAYVSSFK